ncbi:hypothetical protein ACIQU2_27570 [Pseudomonas sp. NPDC098740]|uniref:hypothetical protein n=1 Tax=Pseudomonas sp. NPDC098740 TaxID=3364486 RepID=UPI00383B8C9E
MAKTTTTLAGEEQAAPELTPERLKFRDKVYTSRTLIIPETDRTLPVSKGLVEVLVSDTEAVKFLKANTEFEPAKE